VKQGFTNNYKIVTSKFQAP